MYGANDDPEVQRAMERIRHEEIAASFRNMMAFTESQLDSGNIYAYASKMGPNGDYMPVYDKNGMRQVSKAEFDAAMKRGNVDPATAEKYKQQYYAEANQIEHDAKNIVFPNGINSPIQGYTFDDITKMTEEGGALTCPFGPRNHPTLGGPDNHGGVDIGAPNGTNILAIDDGKVRYQYTEGYGYQAMIEHENGVQSFYAHMTENSYNKYSSLFSKENIFVKKGDVIGEVGSTGRSTGNHLHFTIRSKSDTTLNVSLIKRDGYYNYSPVSVFNNYYKNKK